MFRSTKLLHSSALQASPASSSAPSANGACPGPVGVLRKIRAFTHTAPPTALIRTSSVCHPACSVYPEVRRERSRRDRSEGSALLASARSSVLPPLVTSHQPRITKPFTIRTYEKHARNPFGIRTSQTRDLKSFRIRTYGKRGRGAPGHTHTRIIRGCLGSSRNPIAFTLGTDTRGQHAA
jgi:hypothetical protein